MKDRNLVAAKPLLEKYWEDKKIPLSEVQAWFNHNKGIPTRTFQWYTHEDLIPSPEFDGRNGYYNVDDFKVLVECVDFLMYLKCCSKSQYSIWSEIFKKHKEKIRELLNTILIMPTEYPIALYDEETGATGYSFENEQICLKVLEKLSTGEIGDLKIVPIEKEVKSIIAKKNK